MMDRLIDAGAVGARVVSSGDADWGQVASPGIVRIGVHRGGGLPTHGLESFDILLTDGAVAPLPWIAAGDALEGVADGLVAAVLAQPVAAAMLAQLLRMRLAVSFDQALLIESLAYSTLLASAPFRAWRAANPSRPTRADEGPRVRLDRAGDTLEIILSRPRGRNAVDARMRDALVGALEFAALDPGAPPVVLRGEGASFSIGGDLAEFGRAADVGEAHAIRTLQSPARMLHAIADRATARLHGPCIGAGIEIPAAAGRIVAAPRTRFRLPELAMGLIPGAGGTVTIPRRIGRHRTCFMAIGGGIVDVPTALDWGLIDAVEG